MRVYTLSDMRSKKKLRVYTASEVKGLRENGEKKFEKHNEVRSQILHPPKNSLHVYPRPSPSELDETTCSVYKENVRVTEALNYHVKESDVLKLSRDTLLKANKKLKGDNELKELMIQEKVVQNVKLKEQNKQVCILILLESGADLGCQKILLICNSLWFLVIGDVQILFILLVIFF